MLTFLLPGSVVAQGNGIGLSELINVALEDNPRVRKSRSGVKAAQYGLDEARSALYPQLSYQFNREHVTLNSAVPQEGRSSLTLNETTSLKVENPEEDLSGVGRWRMSLSAEFKLFDFGARASTIESKRLRRESRRYGLDQTESDTVMAVVEAYFELLKARENLQVEKENLERRRDSLDRVQSLHEAGSKAKGDVARVKADVAQAKLQATQAEGAVTQARVQLQNAVGKDLPNQAMNLAEDIRLRETTLIRKDPDELIRIARAQRSVLEKQDKQIASLKAEKKKHERSRLPELDLVASFDETKYKTTDWTANYTVGIRIKGPLFDGFRRSARAEKTGARLQQGRRELDHLNLQVRTEVRKAVNRYRKQRQNFALAKEVVRSRKVDLRLSRKGYKVGTHSIYELSEAENKFRNARADLVSAEMDLQIAIAKLYRAIGRTDKLLGLIHSQAQ